MCADKACPLKKTDNYAVSHETKSRGKQNRAQKTNALAGHPQNRSDPLLVYDVYIACTPLPKRNRSCHNIICNIMDKRWRSRNPAGRKNLLHPGTLKNGGTRVHTALSPPQSSCCDTFSVSLTRRKKDHSIAFSSKGRAKTTW